MKSTTMTSRHPLPREFYARNTDTVARGLLGAMLVRTTTYGSVISGMISETEAYGHADDPASHAYRGRTQRNSIMFGPVGMSYVYFTYGMHYCFNATARNPKRADAGAVLIRGVIPQEGVNIMIKNRGADRPKSLADGPAKLTQAFGINKEQYGEDLSSSSRLCITGNPEYYSARSRGITRSPRVGIRAAAERPWNFKI